MNGTTRPAQPVDGKRAAGALGLLLSLLVWGPLNPARRHRDSHRARDGEGPVLVRAEKRLYQDPARQLLVDERGVSQGKPTGSHDSHR